MSMDSRISATDGTVLSLSKWGGTPPSIVCIHGFADGRYVWSPFAPSLTEYAGVLAMDLRGHGDSEWDPLGHYNTSKFVTDAQTIVDASCSHDLVLIGHSLGAEIVLRLAADNRRRVKALVMVDGGPVSSGNGVGIVRGVLRSKAGVFTSEAAYRQMLGAALPLADTEMLELSVRHTLTGSDEAYRLKCDPRLVDMEPPSGSGKLWSLLESLHVPCLLVRGEASAIVPRHLAVAMTRRVRNLRCATVTMAGHAVMMDNPREFGAILRSFVAGAYGDSTLAQSPERSSTTG